MSSESKETLVLKHLENKYGEDFKIISIIGRNIDMPYDEIIVQNQNGEKFYAFIETKDGEETVRDAYYGVLKAGDYKDIIKEVLNRCFSDCKFFTNFTAGYFDNKYDGNYELADALKDNNAQFYAYVYVFIENEASLTLNENMCEDMIREFENQGLTLHLVIYSLPTEQYLIVNEEDDVNNFIPVDYKDGLVLRKTIK